MFKSITIVLVIAGLNLYAQSNSLELISSSGEFFKNSECSLSWSIGESISEEFIKPEAILTQGFHQGMNYLVNVLENNNDSLINFEVFPTPAKDLINIKVLNFTKIHQSFLLEIIDLQGRFLKIIPLNNDFLQLDLNNLNIGVYFLNISSGSNLIKKYKIQKIK